MCEHMYVCVFTAYNFCLGWCKLESVSCLIDHTAAVCNSKLLTHTHTHKPRLPHCLLMRLSVSVEEIKRVRQGYSRDFLSLHPFSRATLVILSCYYMHYF